ncbi:uncharacterized protein LOC128885604 isoform X1 [Hylaeus anthracinus]|uniref:uncharacterized protein LOC128885604 isoform X1 n=2 Tax=Hylaeus anthracinus TaxID=313031 RepID=UPI0023B990E4|nr:uncharacterized protein LOC128885604 isoform X1 [Hylaeus anthracinus]XP_053995688.1 uncharacterized protein LOC128885604 isoform X1 [Hylaeus anthracinus]
MNECFEDWRDATEEEWTNCHFRKLVPLYRKSPCLWKKDSRHYLDSERRHRAYRRICDAMGLPGVTLVEIVLRIRGMRKLYVSELKKLLEAESSGDCYQNTFPWFYDLHRFLYPYLDYDEAVELHNGDRDIAEFRETNDPRRNPSHCCCVDCPLSNWNIADRPVDRFLPPRQAFCAQASTSSPVVSLPEVRTRPRTCPRSCSSITREDGATSGNVCHVDSDSSSCHGNFELDGFTTDASTGTRQEQQHEFTICGLHNASSYSDSIETDSDHYEAFSTIVARCLRKLGRPVANRAQSEIRKILANLVAESHVTMRLTKLFNFIILLEYNKRSDPRTVKVRSSSIIFLSY